MKFGTKGTMMVDYEERIDFDKLRSYRVNRIQEAMKKTDLGCLILFANENKRYATATAATSPHCCNMGRYSIIPRNGYPNIFGFGSEIAAIKLHNPWIAAYAYPAHTNMFGALPPSWNRSPGFIADLRMVLEQNGINEKEKIGYDFLDAQLMQALLKEGFVFGDAQDVMLDARMIKCEEEIDIMRNAAAIVDAAFYKMAQSIHPGVKENDLQAVASAELHRLGAQWVSNIQVTSGTRTNPHPHLSSDRLIQPGDLVFADIDSIFGAGYRTCVYRTFCCGKPTEKQKAIYNRTYEMLMRGIEKMRVGYTTADVVSVWPTADYWGFRNEHEAFALAFGHGLGTGLWERPIISRAYSLDNPVELQKGMVIALETYDAEGFDGARIELEVIITEGAPEIITKFPCDELLACPIY
jgi:Xaa-Pro aminopeptidase